MKRIQQKSIRKADCGIACVAMVTNNSYASANAKLMYLNKDGEHYSRHKDLISAINELGFSAKLKRFKGFRKIYSRAIVATNIRQDGRWHWVVINGEIDPPYIYDPKPGKPGKITDFRGLNCFGNYLEITPINDKIDDVRLD